MYLKDFGALFWNPLKSPQHVRVLDVFGEQNKSVSRVLSFLFSRRAAWLSIHDSLWNSWLSIQVMKAVKSMRNQPLSLLILIAHLLLLLLSILEKERQTRFRGMRLMLKKFTTKTLLPSIPGFLWFFSTWHLSRYSIHSLSPCKFTLLHFTMITGETSFSLSFSPNYASLPQVCSLPTSLTESWIL